jgi:hypothetical protein
MGGALILGQLIAGPAVVLMRKYLKPALFTNSTISRMAQPRSAA